MTVVKQPDLQVIWYVQFNILNTQIQFHDVTFIHTEYLARLQTDKHGEDTCKQSSMNHSVYSQDGWRCAHVWRSSFLWQLQEVILREWILTLWRRNFFFLILAHPVYKLWIIQEPNKLALWNKLHFEEKKTESIEHV